jgi:hypothetical protein
LWRVDVTPGLALSVGPPTRLATFAPTILAMDATPDRDRFLALSPEPGGIGSATIVQDWHAALDK